MADIVGRLTSALEGRYRIERELGGGGMSRVFFARERAFALRASILYNLPFQRAMRERDAFPAARAALEQALALEPELPEARARLALLLLLQDYDRRSSEREMQRALVDGAGSADVFGTYASALGLWGRFDDAIRAARDAIRLDPQSPAQLHALANWQLAARQFDDALATERRVNALTPANQTAWQIRWQAAWTSGQMDEAIESMIGLFAAARVQTIRPDELKQAFATGGNRRSHGCSSHAGRLS